MQLIRVIQSRRTLTLTSSAVKSQMCASASTVKQTWMSTVPLAIKTLVSWLSMEAKVVREQLKSMIREFFSFPCSTKSLLNLQTVHPFVKLSWGPEAVLGFWELSFFLFSPSSLGLFLLLHQDPVRFGCSLIFRDFGLGRQGVEASIQVSGLRTPWIQEGLWESAGSHYLKAQNTHMSSISLGLGIWW